MFFPFHLQTILIKGKAFSLFVPDATMVQLAYQSGEITFPYWSKVWPAAIGLGEFLCSHPHYIKNKKVLELAAGLGLPSIIAAGSAAYVLSTDYISEATGAIKRSAQHNELKNLTVAVLDWHSIEPGMKVDVLLVSDINYDPAMFDIQHQKLKIFLQQGTTILLSTPQRLPARQFISSLLLYCVHTEEITVVQEEKEILITIFVLQKSNGVVSSPI